MIKKKRLNTLISLKQSALENVNKPKNTQLKIGLLQLMGFL